MNMVTRTQCNVYTQENPFQNGHAIIRQSATPTDKQPQWCASWPGFRFRNGQYTTQICRTKTEQRWRRGSAAWNNKYRNGRVMIRKYKTKMDWLPRCFMLGAEKFQNGCNTIRCYVTWTVLHWRCTWRPKNWRYQCGLDMIRHYKIIRMVTPLRCIS